MFKIGGDIISRLVDLTGKRYGRLVVTGRGEDRIQPSGKKRVYWNVKCDCGKSLSVLGDNLRGGKTTSCGCYRSEKISLIKRTHNESNTKLYGVWLSMKRRCDNSNTTYYNRYGGSGITVCDEWVSSYESFKEWALSNGYKEGLSIDRIDNDSCYCPSNCRWVTSVAQANNRSSNHNITYNGETHNVTEWSKILGINTKTLFNRIYTCDSVEQAFAK